MRAERRVRAGRAWVLLLVVLLMAGGAAAELRPCPPATPDEARRMAERAASLLERVGPERAFRAFMDPAGPFIERDLYVFVFDKSGILHASGAFPQMVGSDASGAQDTSGRFFIREMLRLAFGTKKGAGWVEYRMLSPCSGKFDGKVSYIKRVGNFLVGVGAYGTVSA